LKILIQQPLAGKPEAFKAVVSAPEAAFERELFF
jgi:hypothetical protein